MSEVCRDPFDAVIDSMSSGSSSKELPKAGDRVSEPIMEELRHLYTSNVNISNFVSVSLLGKSNYNLWKEQMLCLLDSQNMGGLVDARFKLLEVKSPNIREQYNSLVKGWIYRSLDEYTHRSLNEDLQNKNDWCVRDNKFIWERLERLYGSEEDPKDDGANDDEEDDDDEDEDYDDDDDEDADEKSRVKNLQDEDLKKRVEDVVYWEQLKVTTTLPPDNEKLVRAVVDGRWWEAKDILKNNKDAATSALLHYGGTTVLHIAVKEGHNNFLERLLDFIDDENKIEVTDDGGCTALHVAAEFNNKRAAQLLVKKRKSLLFCVDDLYDTPLKIAYEFKHLDTFLYLWEAVMDEQGKPHQAIKRTVDEIRRSIDFAIIEDAISTKQYGIASRLVNTFPQVAMQDDRLLMAMARTFPSDLGFGEALICPSLKNFHQRIAKRSSSLLNARGVLYTWADNVLWATRSFKEAMRLLQETVFILLVVPVVVLYPLYQLIRLLILVILYPFFMLYFLPWTVLAIAGMPMMRRIEKKRKIYEEAKSFLNIICNYIAELGSFDYKHPCYNKPFLEAVRLGVFEVVDEILYRSPKLVIDLMDTDSGFFQLAITNRSYKIYNLIYHLGIIRMNFYGILEDSFGNNILHLAGRLAPEHILSRTTGAALQLQRELQWFQEVEKLMLPEDLLRKNTDMETPKMVFIREHADLLKEGEQWMKTTSEANSITAALIVTIVFAAAITVPGGNNQQGLPMFKNEVAFTIFAVCDAISLFSAATALLMSISIRRFAEIDFMVSIPRRLIIGLCALFLSTASMIVAFSAILFLVFCDQRPWMLAPIGGLACMPIAVIVMVQLPFLVDLLKSTYIPIFGKQKYIANGKFISNHPTWQYEP